MSKGKQSRQRLLSKQIKPIESRALDDFVRRVRNKWPDIPLDDYQIKTIKRQLNAEFDAAIKRGCDPLNEDFAEELRMKENDPRALLPIDPSKVEIGENKIKIPHLGWIEMEGTPQPLKGAKSIRATVLPDADGGRWVKLEYETDRTS
jgi:hypothetical protein